MTPTALAQYFGFELHDYKRAGDSILIASGSGLMMAIMDAVPRFRWCIDIDSHRDITHRVPTLMSALDINCQFKAIAVAGWFSVDKPHTLQQGISKVTRAHCITYSGGLGVFPNEHHTLSEYIYALNTI